MTGFLLLIAVFAGFIAAFFAPFINRYFPKKVGAILSFSPAFVFAVCCAWLPAIMDGQVLKYQFSWFPSLGVNLDFLVDGLSLTFGMLISGIGTLVFIYSGTYLQGYERLGRFYAFLLIFMASMMGLVLSDNLFTLFVFWELTSISSYLLIGFNHHTSKSRYAALQALLVTGGGGLAMFGGFILLGIAGGTYSVSEILATKGALLSHPLYTGFFILIALGALTKSAQFPFHFWLPNAMEAPTPVSAYLHSATMVKAGVYLLMRLHPALGGTALWHYTFIILGGITMLLGAAMAVRQYDLKKILAYTTISSLGTLVMLLGIGSSKAIIAAAGFLVVHSLYKGGFFLVAGIIDKKTGTRDVRLIGGLRKYMPFVAVAAVLAALSNAGIPPFFGFIGKEAIYEATVHSPIHPLLITIVTVISMLFIIATAFMVGYKPFFGNLPEKLQEPTKVPLSLWIGPMLLGTTGLIFGIFPALVSSIEGPAVSAIFGEQVEVKLALWHGFTYILALSFASLGGGILVYFLRKKYAAIHIYAPLRKINAEAAYNLLLEGLQLIAFKTTVFFQNGFLRSYLLWIIFATLALAGFALIGFTNINLPAEMGQVRIHEAIVAIIILVAAIVAIKSEMILASIVALGMVGYGIALIFIFFGAPDLAMTQFSIETLTVILFVLIVYRLPKYRQISSRAMKARDVIIASCCGAFMTLLVLVVQQEPNETLLSDYFVANSYILAKGRNVVNVILVDFRALDTLGEITVLAVAAIGVYTLLRLRMQQPAPQIKKELDAEKDELKE